MRRRILSVSTPAGSVPDDDTLDTALELTFPASDPIAVGAGNSKSYADRRVKESIGNRMEHALPPLPYPIDSLAPHCSRETLEYHHGKHHNAYVVNLNNLQKGGVV